MIYPDYEEDDDLDEVWDDEEEEWDEEDEGEVSFRQSLTFSIIKWGKVCDVKSRTFFVIFALLVFLY